MMPAWFEIQGLHELQLELGNLPTALKGEATADRPRCGACGEGRYRGAVSDQGAKSIRPATCGRA